MLNINKTIRKRRLPPKHDKHDGSKLTYGKYCQRRFEQVVTEIKINKKDKKNCHIFIMQRSHVKIARNAVMVNLIQRRIIYAPHMIVVILIFVM